MPVYTLRVIGVACYCAITFSMLDLEDDTSDREITSFYYSCALLPSLLLLLLPLFAVFPVFASLSLHLLII